MPSNRTNSPHSDPIPIQGHSHHRTVSDSSSNGSPSSPPMLQTPISPMNPFPPKIATSPSASPILSYFMSASPTGKSNSLPYRRPLDTFSGSPPVFEDEELQDEHRSGHPRRASTAGWPAPGRFPQPGTFTQPAPEQTQRGAGIMRRLSLSASFTKPPAGSPPRPATPPPSATTMQPANGLLPRSGAARVGRRRATVLGTPESRPQRAPSPMGERMLKGQFDSFN